MAHTEKKETPTYLKLMAAAGPAFALKSIVGDMSKASIESGVENKILGTRGSFAKHMLAGAKGRGTGRMLGGMLGIATAPLFVRGTGLLQSDDKKDKAKGMALIGASTAAFAGAKGFLEAAAGAKAVGEAPAMAAMKGLVLGSTRAAYKLPLALITAAGVAAGRKKSDEKGGSPWSKFIVPMAVGAGAGALSRGVEDAVALRVAGKKLTSSQSLRKMRAAMGGGAAGGVLGGLVLAGAMEGTSRLMNKMQGKEKKAGLGWEALKGLGEIAAHGIPASSVQHAASSAAFGFRGNPLNPLPWLLAQTPRGVQQGVKGAANTFRARQFALGLKEGLQGKRYTGFGAKMVADFSVPEGGISRGLGMKLGHELRDVPPEGREAALKRLQAKLLSYGGAANTAEGAFNPVTGPAIAGISMAIGERPMYGASTLFPTFKKAWVKANLGGTGLEHRGLPTNIGPMQEERGYLRRNIPHFTSTVLGGAAALGTGGLPAFIGGHGVFGGAKNWISDIPAVSKYLTESEAKKAIQSGLFPNIKKSFGERLGGGALEIIAGPATVTMEKGIPGITTSIRDEKLRELATKGKNIFGNQVEKAVGPTGSTWRNTALPAAGAGLGAAGIGAAGMAGVGAFNRSRGSNKHKKK